ncbi:hypothetical protein D3C81_2242020 [compost metagenome]
MSDKEVNKMPVTQIKPIRPTKTVIYNENAQKFENYATQIKKTNTVGMKRMREMMSNFTERRK